VGAHGLDLRVRGCALQVGDAARAQRGVAEQRCNVQRRRRAPHRFEVGTEAREAPTDIADRQRDRLRRRRVHLQRCRADAAVAGDHRGHALRDLKFHVRPAQHGHIVVRVCVDEAGCHDLAARIDALLGRVFSQRAQRHDAAADDADIGVEARRLRAVDHRAAFDQQVEACRCHRRTTARGIRPWTR
jgi:hypothetical protein